MARGTIVSFDAIDGLGWIELDDGTRLRFGGGVMGQWPALCVVGTTLEVLETTTGYKGVVKAAKVLPDVVAAEAAKAAPRPPAASLADIAARYPRWSDVADLVLPFRDPVEPLVARVHPLFAPWHAEMCATAPVSIGLSVPLYRAQDPIDPQRGDSFAHGRLAFLDTPAWPSCGLCGKALEMCIQLAPAIVSPWLGGERGLVAMFCFACGVRHSADPRARFVAFVAGAHRVEMPPGHQSASSGWMHDSQLVTSLVPRHSPPSGSWLAYRAEKTRATASAILATSEDIVELDDFGLEYETWLDGVRYPDGSFGAPIGARMGGEPSWGQYDRTPVCDTHGEMRQLLEYEGGQFLDGSLHVFVCRDRTCGTIRTVAEF